jgi:cell division protein FtsL
MKMRKAPSGSARPWSRAGRREGVHWILVFTLLLAAAFIEVWESTAVSQLSLEIDRLRGQVKDTDARTSFLDARAAEEGSRVRLASVARRLKLSPADPQQIVMIPRNLVAMSPRSNVPESGFAALGRRTAEFFVPAARARAASESQD